MPITKASLSRMKRADFGKLMFRRGVARGQHLERDNQRYMPAADTSRLRTEWLTDLKSPLAYIKDEWKSITSRSERAYRTNWMLRSAINVIENQVVGTGIRPYPAIVAKNGNPVTGLNDRLQDDWKRYNDQAYRGPQEMTVLEAQKFVLRNIAISSGILTNRINSRKGDWLPYGFQLLKPSRLDWSQDTAYDINDGHEYKPDAQTRVHGIAYNSYGEPVDYKIDFDKPAISSDRMKLHFYPMEPEQYFGVPWAAVVLTALWDIENVLDATIIAQRFQKLIAYWIKKDDRAVWAQDRDSDDDTVPMEMGSVVSTTQKPEIIQGDDSLEQSLIPLLKFYIMGIAAGLGISYVEICSDLTDVNFASTRFNKIKSSRFYRGLYKWHSKSWCQYVYADFVRQEFLAGKIPSYSIADYENDSWYYSQCLWLPEGDEWVDPLKDAQALHQAYVDGYVTFQELCASKGKDWRAVLRQRANEREIMKELGISELNPEDQKMIENAKSNANANKPSPAAVSAGDDDDEEDTQ